MAFNVAGPVVVCNVLLSHCGELPNVSENVGNVSIDNIKARQRLPVCVEFCGFQRFVSFLLFLSQSELYHIFNFEKSGKIIVS